MTGHFRFIAGQGTEHGRVTIETSESLLCPLIEFSCGRAHLDLNLVKDLAIVDAHNTPDHLTLTSQYIY